MGALVQAGQILVAGTGPGQLNQYYGFADTTPTTVNTATQSNLCTPYIIPAGEAYTNAAYEMTAEGYGTQASGSAVTIGFQMYLATAFGTLANVAAGALNAAETFQWSLIMKLTCADGVSAWEGGLLGSLVNSTTTLNPGTTANNAIPIASVNTGSHLASVSGALTAVIQVKLGSASGGPTITTTKTTWKKTA